MSYNPDKHKRKSIRLKQYNYSKSGIYFITICIQNRECILGNIRNVGAGLVSAQNILTEVGNIFEKKYIQLENKFNNIRLHKYIFMPNHIHGIIEIYKRADTRPAPTIGDIICEFKSKTTLEYIKGVKEGKYKPFNKTIWQRNYYEHIIMNILLGMK